MNPTRRELAEALYRASEIFRRLGYLALTSRDTNEWTAGLTIAKEAMFDLVSKFKQVTDITKLPVDTDVSE